MINKKDITGIILAGGKSSRMGTDKGFLTFNGRTFTEHIISELKPLVSNILIVSDNSDYDCFNFKRINDVIKNVGPVSGIYSGLKASKTDYNLILSCDIPLIKTKTLKKLVIGIDKDSDIIQFESEGQTMPLIAVYRKKCKDVFKKSLQEDEKRLRVVVNHCKTKNIILGEDENLDVMNVNTQEEFKTISGC